MEVSKEDLKFLVDQLGVVWNNYYYLNTMQPNDKDILAKKLSAERVYREFQARLNEFEGEK